MSRFLVGAALVILVAGPSNAHKADLFTANRVGPIKIGKTTLKQTKAWFGDPSKRRKVTVGCDVELTRVKWGNRLKIYFGRSGKKRVVSEVWVRDRTITFDGIGDLTMHTRKGLKVGDKVKRLKNLYPKAKRYKFKGRAWYELRPAGPVKGRVRAYVKDGGVVALTNPPWEYC
jgi:hypothetical protein